MRWTSDLAAWEAEAQLKEGQGAGWCSAGRHQAVSDVELVLGPEPQTVAWLCGQ